MPHCYSQEWNEQDFKSMSRYTLKKEEKTNVNCSVVYFEK